MRFQERFRNWLYPELEGFDTEEDRNHVLSQCSKNVTIGWPTRLIFFGGIVVAHAWVALQWPIAVFLLGMGMPVMAGKALGSAVYLAIIVMSMSTLFRRKRLIVRGRLQEMLSQKKVSFGLKCGYNLTGNVSGVCPECGEKI